MPTLDIIHAPLAAPERTGARQLDALIAKFVRSGRVGGVRVRDLALDEGRGIWQASHGLCGPVTREFARWLSEAGFDHATTDNDDVGFPAAHGYHDMPFGPLDSCGAPRRFELPSDHCANIVFAGPHAYLIDFTASQYGYPVLPMVQRITRRSGQALAAGRELAPDAFERNWT